MENALIFCLSGAKGLIKSTTTFWVVNIKTVIYGKVIQISSGGVLMFTAEPSAFVLQNKVMDIDAVKVKLQVRTSSLPHDESAVVFLSSENKTKKIISCIPWL